MQNLLYFLKQHPIPGVYVVVGPSEADATIVGLSDSLRRLGFVFPNLEEQKGQVKNVVLSPEEAISSIEDLHVLYDLAREDPSEETQLSLGRFGSLAQEDRPPTQAIISTDGDFFNLLPADGVVLPSLTVLTNSVLTVAVSYPSVYKKIEKALEEEKYSPDSKEEGLRALLTAKSKCGDYGLPAGDGVGWLGAMRIGLKYASMKGTVKALVSAVIEGREKNSGASVVFFESSSLRAPQKI